MAPVDPAPFDAEWLLLAGLLRCSDPDRPSEAWHWSEQAVSLFKNNGLLVTEMALPRGIRNHNPTNLKTGSVWKGLSNRSDEPFCVFTDAEHGLRAAAKVLQTYQTAHKIDTVRAIIGRWAPPEDQNATGAYIASVAIWAGVEADEPIDLYHYPTALAILRAIVRFENGTPPDKAADWYPPEVYERGLRMAGLTPDKPLSRSRTMRGTATATAASAVAGSTLLAQMFGLSPEVGALLPAALEGLTAQQVAWLTLIVAVGGNLYAAWARTDDKRRGRL